jgi:hypothetical protein
LKMGMKDRERHLEFFFCGLFTDEELLCGKGLEPEAMGTVSPPDADTWATTKRP